MNFDKNTRLTPSDYIRLKKRMAIISSFNSKPNTSKTAIVHSNNNSGAETVRLINFTRGLNKFNGTRLVSYSYQGTIHNVLIDGKLSFETLEQLAAYIETFLGLPTGSITDLSVAPTPTGPI
jgi:hypothetical protein